MISHPALADIDYHPRQPKPGHIFSDNNLCYMPDSKNIMGPYQKKTVSIKRPTQREHREHSGCTRARAAVNVIVNELISQYYTEKREHALGSRLYSTYISYGLALIVVVANSKVL